MDAILSTLKDVLKYKTINSINTGDRTFDNLISGFLITIMSLIFTKSMYVKAFEYIREWIPKKYNDSYDYLAQTFYPEYKFKIIITDPKLIHVEKSRTTEY